MKDTVAIIGSHPRTRATFDFDRQDADVWLFNEAISNPENRKWAKRADVIFQMHVPAIWRNPGNRNDPHHYEWLRTQNECDVIMQDAYEDVPRSVRYPLTDIAEMLGTTVADLMNVDHFLSSSVPQAIALAVLYGYKRIEVYGVAMETNTEYQFQREGVAFWIGFARGRGIDLRFADPTFRAPLYGYEGKVSVEYEHFEQRIIQLTPRAEQLSDVYQQVALETKQSAEAFTADSSKPNEQALVDNVGKLVKIVEQLGLVDGAIQVNQHYKRKADTMKDAAEGEFVFSRQEFESAAKATSDQAAAAHEMSVREQTALDIIHQNVMKSAKGSPRRAKFGELLLGQLSRFMQVTNQKYVLAGASQENAYYMQYLDKYIRAAGGSKSEAVLLESMRTL